MRITSLSATDSWQAGVGLTDLAVRYHFQFSRLGSLSTTLEPSSPPAGPGGGELNPPLAVLPRDLKLNVRADGGLDGFDDELSAAPSNQSIGRVYDGGGGGGCLTNRELTGEDVDERGDLGPPSDEGDGGPDDDDRRDLDVNRCDSDGIDGLDGIVLPA